MKNVHLSFCVTMFCQRVSSGQKELSSIICVCFRDIFWAAKCGHGRGLYRHGSGPFFWRDLTTNSYGSFFSLTNDTHFMRSRHRTHQLRCRSLTGSTMFSSKELTLEFPIRYLLTDNSPYCSLRALLGAYTVQRELSDSINIII